MAASALSRAYALQRRREVGDEGRQEGVAVPCREGVGEEEAHPQEEVVGEAYPPLEGEEGVVVAYLLT